MKKCEPKNTNLKRRSVKSKEWACSVKERDNFKCRNCDSEKDLQAHHIIPWRINKDLRFDLNNGLTLCRSCHAKIEMVGNIKNYWKGKKFGEEHRKNLSESHKGQKAWNKGKLKENPSRKICKDCDIEQDIQCFTRQQNWYTNKCKSCRNAGLRKNKGT